jgi:hypothetical protein
MTKPYNNKQNGKTTSSCEHLELDDDQQVATRVEIKKNQKFFNTIFT